jgi:hypothetical protein
MRPVRLHIASGHPVTANLAATGVGGDVLSWPDVLYEGPVPDCGSLEALSYVRAPFIADRYGTGDVGSVLRNLLARNALLARSGHYGEVTLWFSHHLADQLRQLQLLDWRSRHPNDTTRWTIVCIDRHPEVAEFRGLEQLGAGQLAALDWTRRPVHDGELNLARRAWGAFTAADPRALVALAGRPCRSLPFLPAAIVRHLQQFPGRRDGLTRTEREILDHVALRGGTVRDAFDTTQRDYEEAPFMGGATFLAWVEQLAAPPEPLLELGRGFRDDRWACPLRITPRGRAVLAGRADRSTDVRLDRWLGGVRLEGPEPAWCWDDALQTVVARESRAAPPSADANDSPLEPRSLEPGAPS